MSISPTKEGTVSASSSDQSKAAPISPTALVEPSSATIAMGEMMTVWYPMVSAGEGMAGFGAGSASGGSTASHWERTALILRAAAQEETSPPVVRDGQQDAHCVVIPPHSVPGLVV
eukprot:CAMPEP_0173301796 /NCGR_PEP_ID=MMETSP1143-20121109/17989_1 /TAXON_ID=483371 /ORGANISM="non described non described, Strain CCMP2298" /LENGTH=115 /DNA_ID=CAMNT_0014242347 /DNA_START=370 /DNA_END=718 /DNA_ORIENTATION=-